MNGVWWEGAGPQWGIKRTKTRNGRNNTSGLLIWKNRRARNVSYDLLNAAVSSSLSLPEQKPGLRLRPDPRPVAGAGPRGRILEDQSPHQESMSMFLLGSGVSRGLAGYEQCREWGWVGHGSCEVEITLASLETPRLGRRDLGDSVTSEYCWHGLCKKLVIAVVQLFNFSLNPLLPSFQPSQACLFFPTHPPSIAPDHWSIIFFYKSLLNLLQYCFCFMFCFFLAMRHVRS